MTFLMPDKPRAAAPPPTTPTKADSSVLAAAERDPISGYASFISAGAQGPKRKASTNKASLIGGS
jgi:hypothetical protein